MATLFVAFAGTDLNAEHVVYVEAGSAHNGNAVKLSNQAIQELKRGDLKSAHEHLEAAIRLDPKYWPAFYTRAQVFEREGKSHLALQELEHVLRQDSTVVEAALERALINVKRDQCAAALHDLNNVIRIQPHRITWAMAHQYRAILRATCHDPKFKNVDEAIKDAITACKLTTWKDASMLSTLALVYGQAGNFDAAIQYQQEALALTNASAAEAEQYRKQLERLQRHRRYADK